MLRTGIETIICLSPNFFYVYVYVYYSKANKVSNSERTILLFDKLNKRIIFKRVLVLFPKNVETSPCFLKPQLAKFGTFSRDAVYNTTVRRSWT